MDAVIKDAEVHLTPAANSAESSGIDKGGKVSRFLRNHPRTLATVSAGLGIAAIVTGVGTAVRASGRSEDQNSLPDRTPSEDTLKEKPSESKSIDSRKIDYLQYTKFFTEQSLNPDADHKFNEEELRFLEADWNRIVPLIQQRYGMDIINARVLFKKPDPLKQLPGDEPLVYKRWLKDQDGNYFLQSELRNTQAITLWQMHHDTFGHGFFRLNFQAVTPAEQDLFTKLNEGLAEAIAYRLDGDLPAQPESENSEIDAYLAPEGEKMRQQPDIFSRTRDNYFRNAARILAIERVYGPEFISALVRLSGDKLSYADFMKRLGEQFPGITDTFRHEGLSPNPSVTDNDVGKFVVTS